MPKVYFDNNATTPVDPEVFQTMSEYLSTHFGNASSVHQFGQRARSAVENARQQTASFIGAEFDEIVFTAGGTESDNSAILGCAFSRRDRGNHIITTRIEHPAVLKSCEFLSSIGYRISYIRCDQNGCVDFNQITQEVNEKTILISVMAANNETGTIQPIRQIGEFARKNDILFHTDAVQLVGKQKVDVRDLQVDLLSLSAHKFHGPKGTGALYIRKGVEIAPLMLGGGQERGRRGGTENVAGIIGLGKACEMAVSSLDEFRDRTRKMRDRLENYLLKTLPGVFRNGDSGNRLPHVANLSFDNTHGEALLVALDAEGIAVSTGAACHSGAVSPSHVLSAMNLPETRISSALRISLGRFNTEEDIDYALQVIPEKVIRARRAAGF